MAEVIYVRRENSEIPFGFKLQGVRIINSNFLHLFVNFILFSCRRLGLFDSSLDLANNTKQCGRTRRSQTRWWHNKDQWRGHVAHGTWYGQNGNDSIRKWHQADGNQVSAQYNQFYLERIIKSCLLKKRGGSNKTTVYSVVSAQVESTTNATTGELLSTYFLSSNGFNRRQRGTDCVYCLDFYELLKNLNSIPN